MKERLPAREYFMKPLYIVLFIFSFLIFRPAVAQKKLSSSHTSKSKASKSSGRKVFYGQASFYANKFNGRRTSSGQLFNQTKYTCACNMLPLGTWVKVTIVKNGRSVIVVVNDRLHPKMHRVADLSKVAAKKLGYLSHGVARVKIEVLGKNKPI